MNLPGALAWLVESLLNMLGASRSTLMSDIFEPRCEKTSFLARLHEVQKSYCSHPGRTRSRYRSRHRSRHTLLKFSRSLYLDNQWSESIHTWTIGTL